MTVRRPKNTPFSTRTVLIFLTAGILLSAIVILVTFYTKKQADPDVQLTEPVDASIEETLKNLSKYMGGKIRYTVNPNDGRLVFLSGTDNVAIPLIPIQSEDNTLENKARRFLEEYGILFGIENQQNQLKFKLVDGYQPPEEEVVIDSDSIKFGDFDPTAVSHVRFQQVYNGTPVAGSEVIVHILYFLDAVTAVSSSFKPDISGVAASGMSEDQAVVTATNAWESQFHSQDFYVVEADQTVFDASRYNPNSPVTTVLAWAVKLDGFDSESLRKSETFYIDSSTGAVIGQFTNLRTLDRVVYDCDGWLNRFSVCSSWPFFPKRTEESTSSDNNLVNDLFTFNKTVVDGVRDLTDRYGPSGEGGSGNGDAIIFLGNILDSFSFIDFLKTKPQKMYNFVDDFSACRGSPYTDHKAMYICDESSNFITAHEIGHMYVSRLAGLEYQYQSGGLNESYADIFGATFTKQWDLIYKGKKHRDMKNPTAFNHPDRLFSGKYYCGDKDNGGVHFNSGVLNKAFYLTVKGGTFNGCQDIIGIGFDTAFKIYFKSLYYLTPTSNFKDAYDAILNACEVLYNSGSQECDTVTQALQAVEIDQQLPNSQTSPACELRMRDRKPAECASGDPLPNDPPPAEENDPPANEQEEEEEIPPQPPDQEEEPPATCYQECINGGNTPSKCNASCSTRPPDTDPPPEGNTSCRPINGLKITSLSGADLGSRIPREQDFYCKVTTDRINYTTTCGLSVDGGWPTDICRYHGSYGYQNWDGSGKTTTFKCNTKCALDENCGEDKLPGSGNFALFGFDFSSQCGPYHSEAMKKAVTIE